MTTREKTIKREIDALYAVLDDINFSLGILNDLPEPLPPEKAYLKKQLEHLINRYNSFN